MVDNRWFSDIPGTLATRGARELITLWAVVHGVQRHADRRDCFRWPWTTSGQYSAKSTYDMIHQGGIPSELHKDIWKSKATPKSKLFMWLASMHRIWTSDRRLRFGLQATQDACSLCLEELETAEHLLVQCNFSREVWYRCGQLSGANFLVPHADSTIKDWWMGERKRFSKQDRAWFDGLVCMTGYAIWKNRNAWVFGNTQRQHSALNLSKLILDECRLLRMALGV
jgi:hypothetical protein